MLRRAFRTEFVVLSAMFAAIITVLTFVGRIPVGNGYIHVGDSVIYLAACVLPAPYALVAAGMGGAMADALGGFALYIVPTFVIKALISLPFSSKGDLILTKRNALMVIPAGIITVSGYFLTGLILYGWSGTVVGLLGDTIQAIGSAVLFIVLAAALDKAKFKQSQ